MPNFCKVEISGHAGSDAKLRTTSNGKQLCTWTVATGKKGYTQWHSCQAWGETAEIAASITKGSYFKAEGTIQYNKYQEKVYTNIVVFKVDLNPTPPKKVGDTVLIDGEEYEVVPDGPEKSEELPF